MKQTKSHDFYSDQMRSSIKRIFIFAVMVGVVFSAACATKVSSSHVAPARLPVEQLQSLAVVTAPGLYSIYADAATELGVYTSRYLEETGFYRIVQGYPRVLTRDILRPSKDDPLISWARNQGAAGVCILDIEEVRVRSDVTYEQRREEVHTGQYRDRVYIEDNQVKKHREEIVRHETRMIPTLRKRGELRAALTLIDVGTASVRTTQTYEKTLNKTAYGESYERSIDSDTRMIETMARSIAKDIARDLTPHQVEEKVALAEDSKCSDGNRLARQGKWDEATQSWNDVANTDPSNSAAQYNLGVAAEVSRRYKEALGYYEKAASVDPKPLYEDAVRRMRTRLHDQERLDMQMEGRSAGQSSE